MTWHCYSAGSGWVVILALRWQVAVAPTAVCPGMEWLGTLRHRWPGRCGVVLHRHMSARLAEDEMSCEPRRGRERAVNGDFFPTTKKETSEVKV